MTPADAKAQLNLLTAYDAKNGIKRSPAELRSLALLLGALVAASDPVTGKLDDTVHLQLQTAADLAVQLSNPLQAQAAQAIGQVPLNGTQADFVNAGAAHAALILGAPLSKAQTDAVAELIAILPVAAASADQTIKGATDLKV